MALFEKIQFLKHVEKEQPEGILSIYLDTDRSKLEQQHGQWRVRLKNGLRKLEEYLTAQQAVVEKSNFRKLVKKVEKEIHLSQRDHQKGLILFASSDLSIWELEFLQVEVENEFHWDAKPALEQLQTILDNYPPVGLILVQQNKVRLLDTSLGQILADLDYCWDIHQEEWRRNPQDNDFISGNHTPRELKKLIPRLQVEATLRKWKAVYLIGDYPLLDILKQALTNIRNVYVIQKNLKPKTAHELLAQVM